MEIINQKIKSAIKYISAFLKWIIIAGVVGLIGGGVGSLFHISVEYATGLRLENDWIILLLPIGGIVITALYRLFKLNGKADTNLVFNSIRSDERVPWAMAPLIFVSTAITHLFGGSAGREGAALQLGGSIGYQVGKAFHLDEKDMHLIVMCGMSAVFAALFGTPLTATFFSLEVISVGVIYYSAFIPCIAASLTAYGVSLLFGIKPVHFNLAVIPALSIDVILKVVVLAVLCAAVSVLFCLTMHKTKSLFKKKIKNEYIRIIAGAFIIVALTYILQTRAYNGAGMDIISKAMSGSAKPWDFILKIIFTAVTIGVGFKGGEIVPTFFIGATFGCVMGSLLGINAGFGAAIGLVAVFCGVVNSPIASIMLSIELFGSQGLLFFAIACGVSYMLSGYYGLYSSQKIMYSKLKAEFINIYAK